MKLDKLVEQIAQVQAFAEANGMDWDGTRIWPLGKHFNITDDPEFVVDLSATHPNRFLTVIIRSAHKHGKVIGGNHVRRGIENILVEEKYTE